MASKKEKKATKDVDVVAALKAFETILRAASRCRGVAVYRPLLEQLEVLQQEASKPLLAVSLTGASGKQVAAIADCLASYAPLKSISCLGCCCGDEGLSAIAALLQASGSKWWHGCRLQTVEVCNDSRTAGESTQIATAVPTGAGVSGVTGSSCPVSDTVRPATAPSVHSRQGKPSPHQQPYAGLCPAVPGYLQLPAAPQHSQDDSKLGLLREVHYKLRVAHKTTEIRTWALPRAGDPGQPPAQKAERIQHSSSFACDTCPFSPATLQHLSLSLGVSGLQLQRLVLDHTVLGDEGVSTLSAGIHCCSSLQQLSLRYCSIGPAGARQLAAAFIPASSKHASFVGPTRPDEPRMSSCSPGLAGAGRPGASCKGPVPSNSAATSTAVSTGSVPLLQELHLDGNPLTASGLHDISKALKLMTSIKVLSLGDIGLDCEAEADAQAVQLLVHSLLSGPNELAELDLSGTSISDECGMLLLGLLKAKESLIVLKLAPHISREIVQQMTALLQEHQKAAKPLKAAKKAVK